MVIFKLFPPYLLFKTVIKYFVIIADFTTLQRTCSEKPLEEMVLEVKRTFEGGVILVSNPLPKTTDDCFVYYFKNTRRSGGDQSATIMKRDPAHKFLLVQFSSKEGETSFTKDPDYASKLYMCIYIYHYSAHSLDSILV